MKEDMRDLFFIVKGQYSNTQPKVMCEDGVERCFGGYDPEDPNTKQWYRVLDNEVFYTVYCGSSYERALNAIRVQIKTHKTRKHYFKHIWETTSEDYYPTHYLGKTPLTPEQRVHRCEDGKCPRVSPIQKSIDRKVFELYGSYYSTDIERVEDEVYEHLNTTTPLVASKKTVNKIKVKKETPLTPKEKTIDTKVVVSKIKKPKLKLR